MYIYFFSFNNPQIAKERNDSRTVFEQTKILWSYADPMTKAKNPLLKGVHRYYFSQVLPKKLPSTFHRQLKGDLEKTWVVPSKGYLPRRIDPVTSITYKVCVKIVGAHYNEENVVMIASCPFRVLENISEAVLYREPVTCSGAKKFLFGGNLPARLVATTKYCHFIGDVVPLEVEIYNDSSKNVDSIGLSATQNITYKAGEESLTQEVTLLNEVMPGTQVPAGAAKNFTLEFDIPQAAGVKPYEEISRCGTISYGTLIKVEYMVHVRLMVHNALDLKVSFPLHLVPKSEGVAELRDCLHESLRQFSSAHERLGTIKSPGNGTDRNTKEDKSLDDLFEGEHSEESAEIAKYAERTDYQFNSFI